MQDYQACRRLKYIHKKKEVVEDILKKLNEKFGQESPLTTCQGKVLEYLGMKISYRQQGKVKFTMYDYVEKMLEELPKHGRTSNNTSIQLPIQQTPRVQETRQQ